MICDLMKIILFKELINTNKLKIKELEKVVKECNDKQLDSSVIQDEINTNKRWQRMYQEGLELEDRKCVLFKMLQNDN
jgi:hypothetical protein